MRVRLVFLLAALAASASAAPFDDGLTDRGLIEAWLARQTDEFRDGAFFWAGQRSLQRPRLCGEAARNEQWRMGCVASRAQFAPTDVRRRTEPEYRRGWNSWNPQAANSAATVPIEARNSSPLSEGAREAQTAFQQDVDARRRRDQEALARVDAAAEARAAPLRPTGVTPATHFQDGYGRWWPREEVQWYGPQGTVDCTLAPNPERYAEWFEHHLQRAAFGAIPQGSTVSIGRLASSETATGRETMVRDVFIRMNWAQPTMADVPEHLRLLRLTLSISYSECVLAVRANALEASLDWQDWRRERGMQRTSRPR